MEYGLGLRLLGRPLVHVARGTVIDGRARRGVARGSIAVGDVTLGVLFAAGGVGATPGLAAEPPPGVAGAAAS